MRRVIRNAGVLALLCSGLATAAGAAPQYHLIRKIHLAGAGGWDYLALDTPSRRLYIARFTHVTVLDVDTGRVVGDIPGLAGVHGVAVDHRSGLGFTSNGQSNTVTIFSLKTFRKIRDVAVDKGPDAIIFDPATERVFTFNGHANTATAIDGATGKVVGTVPLPGRPEFPVADGRGHIYDNIEDKNEVAEINSRTLRVEAVWPISPGEEPSGIAMDRAGRRIFSVCRNKQMTVLNANNGHLIAGLPIGNGPDACAFDPTLKLAFSPNGRDGTLSVWREVNPYHFVSLGTAGTQVGARTMALDTKTHHIFLISAKAIPPPPGAPHHRMRPRYVPGTVVVLEVGP